MPYEVHSSKRRETLPPLPMGELVTWQPVASRIGCRADRVLFVRELMERFGEAYASHAGASAMVPRGDVPATACAGDASDRYPVAMGGPGCFEVMLA